MGAESIGYEADLVAALQSGVPLEKITLPRHRHQLPAEAIEASQRWRLLGATAKVIAAKGYWPATIASITAEAGVSKKTFYKYFTSKEDAFMTAYEAIDVVIDTVEASLANAATLDELLNTMIWGYLGLLEAAPDLTTMLLFQALGATPAIGDRRVSGIARYTQALQQALSKARGQGIAVAVISDPEMTALLGGINELCVQHIQLHGAAGLSTLAPALCSFTARVLRPPAG